MVSAKAGMSGKKREQQAVQEWELRLYAAGRTSRSAKAMENLKLLCEAPQRKVPVPTLVRKLPEPVRNIIGDLSNIEKVLVGLDLRPTD